MDKSSKLYRTYRKYRNSPEDERDGRSDLQILADEVSYRLSLYTEGGTCAGGRVRGGCAVS